LASNAVQHKKGNEDSFVQLKVWLQRRTDRHIRNIDWTKTRCRTL